MSTSTSPFGGGGRRSRSGMRWLQLVVAVALFVSAFAALAVPAITTAPRSLGGGDGSPGGGSPPEIPPSLASSICNPATKTPSSLLVPLAGPSASVPSGGSLRVVLEAEVVNYTSTDTGVTVYVPSVDATFPLSPSGTLAVYAPPRTWTVTGAGWTVVDNTSKSATASVTFAPNATALLSSQKLAVMATRSYGGLTLAFRWQWATNAPGGSAVYGAWSTPTRNAAYPTSLATIFYPAPYVQLVRSPASAEFIGTTLRTEIGGSVAGRYFFQELENASTGKVFQSVGETVPTTSGSYNLSIPLINYDNYLMPGKDLLHLHDGCGAMLYSLTIAAAYAPGANVTVEITPSSCGTVTLNGSAYGNGVVAHLRPSATTYPFSVSGCSGHTFQSWNGTGGIHVASAGALLVSATGTFAVVYR